MRKELLITIFMVVGTIIALIFFPIKIFKKTECPVQESNQTTSDKTVPLKKEMSRPASVESVKKRNPPSVSLSKNLSESANTLKKELRKEINDVSKTTGTGRFTGKVLTSDNQPLPDVQVRAVKIDTGRWNYYNRNRKRLEIGEKVDFYIKSLQEGEKNTYESSTDAQGRFHIDGVPQGKYWFEAFAEGYQVEQKNQRGYNIEPDADITFIARQLIEVKVQVQLPDGSLAPSAKIDIGHMQLPGGYSSWPFNWAPDNDVIELWEDGCYTLTAKSEEKDMSSDAVNLVFRTGNPPEQVVLKLRTFPGIKGKLVFRNDNGINNSGRVEVYAILHTQGKEVTKESLQQGNPGNANNYNGYEFNFDKLIPGNYVIGCFIRNRLLTEEVRVVDRVVIKDIEIPPLNPSDYVTLWILDPKNSPLIDCQISAGYRGKEGNYSGYAEGVTLLENSSYQVILPTTESNIASPDSTKYEITVRSGKYGEKKVSFASPPPEQLTVKFESEAFLEVSFSNLGQVEYADRVGCSLFPETEKRYYYNASMNGPKINSSGILNLGPVQPGKYTLVVFVKTDRWQYSPVQEIPVDINAGDNTLTVTLPELYSLTVLASPRKAGRGVSLMKKEGEESSQKQNMYKNLDKDGKAEFGNLSAGNYEIFLDGKKKSVSIPDVAEIEIGEQ